MKVNGALFIVLCFACSQPATTNSDTDSSENSIDTEVAAPTVDDESATVGPLPQKDPNAVDSESGPIVYVTADGDKYHTADCRYSKTAHEVKLSQAKADGKTACGVCKPNSKTGEKQLRCSANTSDGTRCKRMTTDAKGKCFQHREAK